VAHLFDCDIGKEKQVDVLIISFAFAAEIFSVAWIEVKQRQDRYFALVAIPVVLLIVLACMPG
jgi:hypothetical protein